MEIRFWGTRGSIPAPGRQTMKYGGNTSCVEVRANDGTHIILDCGTGARELGQHLIEQGPTESRLLRLHLLIGHIHWDHIHGFPFFGPAFLPGTELNIYAPTGFERSLDAALAGQMNRTYFPVKLRELPSRIHITQLEEGFFRLGSVLVETQYLNHTAPTIAYRLTADGATVVYATDHEPFWKPCNNGDFSHPGDQRHVAFLEGADLLIHDAQYTDEEYAHRRGWGHSTVEYVADVAAAAEVGRLALFHHDPARDDATLGRLEELARFRMAAHAARTEVFAAAEGLGLKVEGSRTIDRSGNVPALSRVHIAGSCVLVVTGSDSEWGIIDRELGEDNLVVVRASNGQAALEQIPRISPDLVILSADGSNAATRGLAPALRAFSGWPHLPVLLLTAEPYPEPRDLSVEMGITDYLAKPFSPPMLRSRVRAWLARTSTDLARRSTAPFTGEGDVTTIGWPGSQRKAATREQIREALASIELFQSLGRDDIDRLTTTAAEEYYGTGRTIVEQGEGADRLLVILSGRVRVLGTPDDLSTSELVLSELGPGEILGEMGILTGTPRTATAVALDPTRCLALPAAEFLRLVQSVPSVGAAISQTLAQRISDMNRKIARYVPDALTGLLTRRALQEQYPQLASQARRKRAGVLLILLDLIDLKAINDRFGYPVGDDILRAVAQVLLRSARKTDLAVRYGGDEFAMLRIGIESDAVDAIAGRIERRLSKLARRQQLPGPPRCAIGVATAQVPPDNLDTLVRPADADMQRRKPPSSARAGRDQEAAVDDTLPGARRKIA